MPNCVKLELRKKEVMYKTYLYLLVVYLMSLSTIYTVQHGIWYVSSGNQEAKLNLSCNTNCFSVSAEKFKCDL